MMRAVLLWLLASGCVNGPLIMQPTKFVRIHDERFQPYAARALAPLAGLYRWEGEPAEGEQVVEIVSTQGGWGAAGGTERYDAGTIYLDAGMNTDSQWAHAHLTITLMHALGHAAGLCHSKDPENVMYTSSTAHPHTVESAAEDIFELLAAGGNCPPGSVHAHR